MAEELVAFMSQWFIPREHISKYCGLNGDPISTKSLQDRWREAAISGTAMMALQQTEGQSPRLIGVNMTTVSAREDKDSQNHEGEHFNNILGALSEVSKRTSIYGKYEVDKYLNAYGLSVDANYSGFNVGLRILECRKALCKVLGLEATGTVFTAPASQHLARKVGFETLAESDYATCTVDGKKPFEKLSGKIIMMGLLFK